MFILHQIGRPHQREPGVQEEPSTVSMQPCFRGLAVRFFS